MCWRVAVVVLSFTPKKNKDEEEEEGNIKKKGVRVQCDQEITLPRLYIMRIKPWLFLLNVIIHIIFLFLFFFSEKAVRDPTTTSPREKRFVVYSPRGGEIRGVSSSRIAALSSVYKKRIEKNVNIMKGREKRRRRIREDISFPKWESSRPRALDSPVNRCALDEWVRRGTSARFRRVHAARSIWLNFLTQRHFPDGRREKKKRKELDLSIVLCVRPAFFRRSLTCETFSNSQGDTGYRRRLIGLCPTRLSLQDP